MNYAHPEYLISSESLAEKLAASKGNGDIKVFDTAVYLMPKLDSDENGAYQIDSGSSKYLEEHIAGAGFIDLLNDWADTDSKLNFTLPNIDALRQAIGTSGISGDEHVVLYSSGHLMWATRAWWLLHHAGHTNMSILNGNLNAWKKSGLPLGNGDEGFPPTHYKSGGSNNEAFAHLADVEAGMHGEVCTINALTQSLYEGSGDFYYQRRGHIPGSHLVYYDTLLDDEFFKPAEQLHSILEAHGALSSTQVITYCGGGIAATLDAFACKLLGQHEVQVYDGSMSEWVQDENRPLTVGAEP